MDVGLVGRLPGRFRRSSALPARGRKCRLSEAEGRISGRRLVHKVPGPHTCENFCQFAGRFFPPLPVLGFVFGSSGLLRNVDRHQPPPRGSTSPTRYASSSNSQDSHPETGTRAGGKPEKPAFVRRVNHHERRKVAWKSTSLPVRHISRGGQNDPARTQCLRSQAPGPEPESGQSLQPCYP